MDLGLYILARGKYLGSWDSWQKEMARNPRVDLDQTPLRRIMGVVLVFLHDFGDHSYGTRQFKATIWVLISCAGLDSH